MAEIYEIDCVNIIRTYHIKFVINSILGTLLSQNKIHKLGSEVCTRDEFSNTSTPSDTTYSMTIVPTPQSLCGAQPNSIKNGNLTKQDATDYWTLTCNNGYILPNEKRVVNIVCEGQSWKTNWTITTEAVCQKKGKYICDIIRCN